MERLGTTASIILQLLGAAAIIVGAVMMASHDDGHPSLLVILLGVRPALARTADAFT